MLYDDNCDIKFSFFFFFNSRKLLQFNFSRNRCLQKLDRKFNYEKNTFRFIKFKSKHVKNYNNNSENGRKKRRQETYKQRNTQGNNFYSSFLPCLPPKGGGRRKLHRSFCRLSGWKRIREKRSAKKYTVWAIYIYIGWCAVHVKEQIL